MRKWIIASAIGAIAVGVSTSAGLASSATYTFDYPTITASSNPGTPVAPSNTIGTAGQDNFYHVFGVSGAFRNDPMPGFTGNWLGSLPTTPSNAPASDGIESRVNNSTFSYSLGSTSYATFSADVLVGLGNTTTSGTNSYKRSVVAPGVDLNGDGGLRLSGTNAQSAETAFQFGYESSSGIGWYIRGAAFGTSYPNVNNAPTVTGTWETKLLVDFTANSGDGAGTLFIKQLYDGAGNPVTDTFHLALPSLQAVNLQLKRMNDPTLGGTPTANDPSTWNGFFARVANNGGIDNINFSSAGGASVWIAPTSGSALVAGNWFGGVPNAIGATAEFSFGATSNATVYADGDTTVGTLRFDNAISSYQITGTGSMTLQTASGNALIDVVSGSHKVNIPLNIASNTTINVAAGTTLRISDPITVQSGKSITQSGSGTLLYESTITVLSGASIVLGGSQTISSLSLGTDAVASLSTPTGAPGVVTFNALGLARGAHLDLGVSELRFAGSVSEAFAAIRAGDFLTSAADARHGLGYGDAGDGKVRVLFTTLGDATLDRTVDFADLQAVAQNYQAAGNVDWSKGDFNNDGKVTLADLVLLAQNYHHAATDGTLAAGSAFASDWELAQATAPEPTTVALLSLPLALSARRRRGGQRRGV